MQYEVAIVPIQLQSTDHILPGYNYAVKLSYGTGGKITALFRALRITQQGLATFSDSANDRPCVVVDLLASDRVTISLIGQQSSADADAQIMAQGTLDLLKVGCNIEADESVAKEGEVILKGASIAGPVLMDYALVMFPQGCSRPMFQGGRGAPLGAQHQQQAVTVPRSQTTMMHQNHQPTTRGGRGSAMQPSSMRGGRGSIAMQRQEDAELNMILEEILVKEEQLKQLRGASQSVPALKAQLQKKQQQLDRIVKEDTATEEDQQQQAKEDEELQRRIPKLRDQALALRAAQAAAERRAAEAGVDVVAVLNRFKCTPTSSEFVKAKQRGASTSTNPGGSSNSGGGSQQLRELKADLLDVERQMALLEKQQSVRDVTAEACGLMEMQTALEGLIRDCEAEESKAKQGGPRTFSTVDLAADPERALQRDLVRSRIEKMRMEYAVQCLTILGSGDGTPPGFSAADEEQHMGQALSGILTQQPSVLATASSSPPQQKRVIEGKVQNGAPASSTPVVQGTVLRASPTGSARHLPPTAQPDPTTQRQGTMDDLFA